MENLIFNSKNKLNTTNLVRVGDLSYFEGPLLSLFEDISSGHFYLFDWVDRDTKTNRWIIYRVSPKDLLNYLNGKITHLDIFNNRPIKSVFFTDIDCQNRPFYLYDAFELNTIPTIYLPNNDIFFDLSDCYSFEKIKSVVIRSHSRQKSENEYSKFFLPIKPKPIFNNTVYFNNVYGNRIAPKQMYNNVNISITKVTNDVNYLNNLVYPKTIIAQKFVSIKRKEYENQYSKGLS